MKKLLIVLLFLLSACAKENGNDELKEIEIVVEDRMHQEIVYQETISTNAATLEDLLKETQDLHADLKEGPYGEYIDGLCHLKQKDGYYWIYESTNNEVCQKMGICPVLKEVLLQDQDSFLFQYTNTFE